MAASEDLVNFDIIESQKENIQSLPGGRSAKELSRLFSPQSDNGGLSCPSPDATRTINDGIRQEYEAELMTVEESDDPLDIYDRYVKWTLNAFPSAQATPESGLLQLLERAIRAFLPSAHYKNDSRYLKLWLHYIRLFSDAPRETFAFLARHHIGECLALFYEEFAAWLETVGRWTQADEVYKLGISREARPVERLIRKYDDFQQRYERRTHDNGPSSPALSAVRPALAAKVDSFVSSSAPTGLQAQQSTTGLGGTSKPKPNKQKMTIFSDATANEPAVGGQSRGWESIGSIQERKKENYIEPRPWAGETLKVGKKSAPVQKMAIFRDESTQSRHLNESKQTPECRMAETINPRTGRRERVFVNLEAVYPDGTNPSCEISFEELRAINRGWTNKVWRRSKMPLAQVSGNAPIASSGSSYKPGKESLGHEIDSDIHDYRASKTHNLKLREVKGETQTIKMNFDSPTGQKIRRRSTTEPTMTIHTRAATDEIYDIFNQPLKSEIVQGTDSSDFEDDDYTSAGGNMEASHVSVASSEFGDDEAHTFNRSYGDMTSYDDTRAESVAGSEWTEFTAGRDMPAVSPTISPAEAAIQDNMTDSGVPTTTKPERERFIPEMPDDYHPPTGLYRGPEVMAQNRLPFMTPIVERTEHSVASITVGRRNVYDSKTPSKFVLGARLTPVMSQVEDILSSPLPAGMSHEKNYLDDDITGISPIKETPSVRESLPFSWNKCQQDVIIKDPRCNPIDTVIRAAIIESLDPPLVSYPGYFAYSETDTSYSSEIQRFIKSAGRRHKSSSDQNSEAPVLEFPDAARRYIIRKELGAGAYAPVYLAESIQRHSKDTITSYTGSSDGRLLLPQNTNARYDFEAVKLETGAPSAWEFYLIRTAHKRIAQTPKVSRAAASIIQVHELHAFKAESFLVEDYRGQGTLLDLVNIMRSESLSTGGSGDGGLDEALAMFFTIELFRTVEALHTCGILHGDIKPDNCLVRFDNHPESTLTSPASTAEESEDSTSNEYHYSPGGAYGWKDKGVTLIDFGRSIDMHAFSPSVQFIADWDPSAHECNEIREMRPWTHQIDLYGLAVTIHVILFGKYLESVPTSAPKSPLQSTNTKMYHIRETLKRYWDREIWSDVFELLLNPTAARWRNVEGETDSGLPALNCMGRLRERMERWLTANAERRNLLSQIRKLETILRERKRKLEKW